jgi:hypothetical protein
VEDGPEAVEQLGCVSGGIAVVTVAAKNPRVHLHQYLRATSARGVGRCYCIRQRMPEDLRRMRGAPEISRVSAYLTYLRTYCIRERMLKYTSCNRAATELQQSCNRASTKMHLCSQVY